MEVSFLIQKKSKNGKIFHVTEPMYLTAAQVLRIKKESEVKHELICRILPKWSSFDDFTRKDIFLMMDHINSYKREKLNNCSPYETFSFYYREDVLRKLGCRPGDAENIILTPKFFKK
jgi:IS30 family transposase